MTEQEFREIYKQTFDRLHASTDISMEVESMRKTSGRIRRKRFAAAACLLLAVAAVGTTAVNAATDGKLVETVTVYITGNGEQLDILWCEGTDGVYVTTDGDICYYVYTEGEPLATEYVYMEGEPLTTEEILIRWEDGSLTEDEAVSVEVRYFDVVECD